jgi:hypothetical protein
VLIAIAKEAADVLKHKFFFMRLIQIVEEAFKMVTK